MDKTLESEEKYGKITGKGQDIFENWDITDKGYYINHRNKKMGEVFAAVEKKFKDEYPDLYAELDHFGAFWPTDSKEMPDRRWLGVFYVTGDSEGHYIHVEAIGTGLEKDKRECLFLGKTFTGRDHAEKVVCALSRILEV
jgi:hypothetical protein